MMTRIAGSSPFRTRVTRSRSATAALANMLSLNGTRARDRREKFLATCVVGLEETLHRGGSKERAALVDPAASHAAMGRLDHDGHSPWIERRLNGLCNIGGQPFL